MPAGTTQTLFEDGAGHAGVIARQKAGGVKLHHFHIAQFKPGAQGHGKAIHRLVARGGVVFVHGRAAARRHHHRLGTHKAKAARAHVDEQHPGKRAFVCRRDKADGAVFLKFLDRAREHLFHQAADDLDARKVALVHRAVGRLAGKGLLVQASIRVAVKETADFVLKLADAHDRLLAELPGHILIGEPFSAPDRIHEMPLDGVTAAKRHVIAALNHPGAAAFADKALDSDGDAGARRGGLLGVQGRKKPRAAGADDQDIGVMAVDLCGGSHGLYRFQKEGSGDQESDANRPRRQGFLTIRPWQEFKRQKAKAAEHMHRKQEDEAEFSQLYQRHFGEGEEPVKARGVGQRL